MSLVMFIVNFQKTEQVVAVLHAARDNVRVLELEEEIQELRRKLDRAEARLAHKEGSVGILTREVTLERELDEVRIHN
jgi:predicted translin family RNA/ssDNA-binding protein